MNASRESESDSTWWKRGLARITGPDGIIAGFAFDHRNSMASDLQAHGLPNDAAYIREFKRQVIASLAPAATLVLLDHEYGLQAVASGAVPGRVAFAMPLEARRSPGAPFDALTQLMPEWTARQARHVGADACKLLLPLRMDHPRHADVQLQTCRTAVAACHEAGVIPIIEPVAWPDRDAEPGSSQLGELAVAGAHAVSRIGSLVVKVQYPGAGLLMDLDEACRPNPWVLLGGGATGAEILEEVEHAARAGASGFLVGRTLFRPALQASSKARTDALRTQSIPLLTELAQLAHRYGRPAQQSSAREAATTKKDHHA